LPPDKRLWRSEVFEKAYRILQKQARANGPGLIFQAFTLNYSDRSLEIYVDHFNSLQNPSLDPDQATWVALVCDINLLPFLEKRFPQGEWHGIRSESGSIALGILPKNALTPEELLSWVQTHQALSEMNRLELYKRPADPWTLLAPMLETVRLRAGNDPLLQTIYAEEAIQYFAILNSIPLAIQAADHGILAGYPTAFLYNSKGFMLTLLGRYPEAVKCFQQACAAPGNATQAAQNLEKLIRSFNPPDQPGTMRPSRRDKWTTPRL
jgi:tetratricopeptide (TPR) repeat protein